MNDVISPLCWWKQVINLFLSFKFDFFTSLTFQYFLWYTLLDELEQIVPQSKQNWISSHVHKSSNNDSNFLISHYYLSAMISSQSSARNLGVIFDSDMSFTAQIKSLSKSYHLRISFIMDICRIRHLLPFSVATSPSNSHICLLD